MKETQRQHKLPVHEKTTYNSRINYRNSAMIQPKPSDDEAEQESDNAVAVKDDPQFTIAVTRGKTWLYFSRQKYVMFVLSVTIKVSHLRMFYI